MSCSCNVGPGKFEGEDALAFLAWEWSMLGGSDATTFSRDMPTDWFRRPLNFDTDQEVLDRARAYGYCDACLDEALASEAYGLAVWADGQGFVNCVTFETQEEFDKALGDEEEW